MIEKPFTVHRSPFTGYTLIELLVGITIISIVFSIGTAGYREFSRRQALTGVSKKVVSDLRLLQQKALSGEKPSGCTILSGYQFNVVPPSTYRLEAVCLSNYLIREENLSSLGITISATYEPIKFKVLGQGTNLSSDSIITLTNSTINRNQQITVGIGGDVQ